MLNHELPSLSPVSIVEMEMKEKLHREKRKMYQKKKSVHIYYMPLNEKQQYSIVSKTSSFTFKIRNKQLLYWYFFANSVFAFSGLGVKCDEQVI